MGFIHNAGMRPNALPRIRWKNIYFVHLTKYTYEKTTTVNFGHVGMIPTHDPSDSRLHFTEQQQMRGSTQRTYFKIFLRMRG